MTDALPLLETRLTLPQVRPGRVARPRLAERLDAGLSCALTLVSAPAGFGKTTLVAEWLAERAEGSGLRAEISNTQRSALSPQPLACAWLALSEDDNDLLSFWIYLISAVQRAAPALGARALAQLQAAPPAQIKAVIAALLNDLARLSGELALVLDDYHLIQTQPIHDTLTYLLTNLPPQVHLVLITRADPPLPLSRLRVRGQLIEIRANDLLFTRGESERFLNQTMALGLSPEELAALAGHTEGWIAALQLAALALSGRAQADADRDRLISALGSAGRHIVDYLVDEVLSQQPAEIQQFLLRTSILSQLSGPLCDALMAAEGAGLRAEAGEAQLSASILQSLERANLFLVPLDAERRWYRYHHLFAACLRERLRGGAPGLEPELHRRAAGWYEGQGEIEQAASHALAAQDEALAARLLQPLAGLLESEGRLARLLELLGRLADPLMRARPALCLIYARTLLLSGQPGAVESYLRSAEAAADDSASAADQALRGSIAAIRASAGSLRGDPQRTIDSAHQALALLPADDVRQRGTVAKVLGIAHMTAGAIGEGARWLEEAIRLGRQSGNTYTVMTSIAHMTEARQLQGDLHAVAALCREALAPGVAGDVAPASPARCLVQIVYGALKREWGDLPGAEHDLRRALDLAQQGGDIPTLANAYMELGALRRSQGDLAGALQIFEQGAALLQHPSLDILLRPMLALRARALIGRGEIAAVERWAQEYSLGAAEEFDYIAEIEHAVLARLRIAQGRAPAAVELLGRMIAAAAAGGRSGRVIELEVLMALARERAGQPHAAQAALGRALELAAPAGYVRTFIDEGPALAAILERMKDEDRRMQAYIAQLLGAFPSQSKQRAEPDPQPSALSPQPLPEPLTEREREVLGLVAAGATNQEIAAALVISLGTVKAHISHILGKLDARNRTEALLRAQQLGLLPRSSSQ